MLCLNIEHVCYWWAQERGALVFEPRRFVELRKKPFWQQFLSSESTGMGIFYTLNVFCIQARSSPLACKVVTFAYAAHLDKAFRSFVLSPIPRVQLVTRISCRFESEIG